MLTWRLYTATEIHLGKLKKTTNSLHRDNLFYDQRALRMLLITVTATLTCSTLVLNIPEYVLLDKVPAPDNTIQYNVTLYYIMYIASN
jgi:hypothetical protein